MVYYRIKKEFDQKRRKESIFCIWRKVCRLKGDQQNGDCKSLLQRF